MKYAIISGSHRLDAQSDKIARYIETVLKRQSESGSVDTYLFSLRSNPLPLWDESIWAGDKKWDTLWAPISRELKDADAIIIVAPEWGGMVPAGLRNVFHFCGGSTEFAHKPGLIVGVSSSTGGAYPVAELRMTSSKNTRICYIPDHLIVRNCEKVLNSGPSSGPEDTYVRDRIEYTLKVLACYAPAFRQIRQSGVIDLKAFPFGM